MRFKRDYDVIQDPKTGIWWAWPRPTWWTNLLIALAGVTASGSAYLLTYWWLPDWIGVNIVDPLLSLF